jgi:hypothetical protein
MLAGLWPRKLLSTFRSGPHLQDQEGGARGPGPLDQCKLLHRAFPSFSISRRRRYAAEPCKRPVMATQPREEILSSAPYYGPHAAVAQHHEHLQLHWMRRQLVNNQ